MCDLVIMVLKKFITLFPVGLRSLLLASYGELFKVDALALGLIFCHGVLELQGIDGLCLGDIVGFGADERHGAEGSIILELALESRTEQVLRSFVVNCACDGRYNPEPGTLLDVAFCDRGASSIRIVNTTGLAPLLPVGFC
jgi:hypothetical protein